MSCARAAATSTAADAEAAAIVLLWTVDGDGLATLGAAMGGALVGIAAMDCDKMSDAVALL